MTSTREHDPPAAAGEHSADVCVVGGGPAGMMLGLLLARRGLRTVVLEKHEDFLRDFRGDTVHPSTLALLDQIGLGERARALPGRRVSNLRFTFADGTFQVADFSRLRGDHRWLLFVPQWDLLEMLAQAGAELPTFRLLRGREVTGLIREPSGHGEDAGSDSASGSGTGRGSRAGTGGSSGAGSSEGGQVVGVRAVGPHGPETVRARLTVGADGRGSLVRAQLGLTLRRFGAPMDVLWFRLPRRVDDGAGLGGLAGAGQLLIRIDRGDYWQIAYLIRKGGYDAVRARGLDALRQDVAALAPGFADRVREIRSWDDVHLLTVQIDRARRWHAPGALVVGDAAHAMSPIGGVGINLAIQDAVAAARLLAGPLLAGREPVGREPVGREPVGQRIIGQLPELPLGAVQRRRVPPTVLTQLLQRVAQRAFLGPTLDAAERPAAPAMIRWVARHPAAQGMFARIMGIGFRPEPPGPAESPADRTPHRQSIR